MEAIEAMLTLGKTKSHSKIQLNKEGCHVSFQEVVLQVIKKMNVYELNI